MSHPDETSAALWSKGGLGKRQSGPPSLLFAQVKEDAAIELDLLSRLREPGAVFAIGSGGCTAFSLLAARPERLFAIDLNPAQVYLMELKKAALQTLSYDELRAALDKDALPRYPALRPLLSEGAQEFWDKNSKKLGRGLNHSGLIERNLRRAMQLFHAFIHGRRTIDDLFSTKNLEAQRALYRERWDTWRWRAAFSVGLSRPLLRLVYGKSALAALPRDFASQMKRQIDEVFLRFPLRENGYLWQLFLETDPPEEAGLPPYLQQKHQSAVREGLARTSLLHAEASAWLAAQPQSSIDFFALSNIPEVCPPAFVQTLLANAARCATPGALACLRLIFPPPPDIQSLWQEGWHLEEDLSQDARAKERSPFCQHILVLRRKP